MALAAAGCLGDTAGPHPMRPAAFSFAPQFSTRAAGVVVFDRVRLTLLRTSGVAFDTIVAFPSDSDSLHLVLTTPISGSSETLTLTLEMINAAGDTVFRGGPLPVTLSAIGGGASGVSVPVRYSGVGANAKSLRLSALAASLFFRDSLTLTGTALDSAGQPIPGTPIGWRSLDTALAKVRVDTLGRIVAGTTRGVARIEASLPTGQADTALVTVQPVPAVLSIVSGNAQTGPVGTALAQALVVKVKAADSAGVQGVVLAFSVASGGGSLSRTIDTTDAAGSATTAWTLGTALGAQSVTATVVATPSLTATLSATAVAGAPKKLAFVVQPSNVAAGVAMVPAVQVVAQDSFGNTVTGFTGNVTLAIGSNPGGSTLGGTVTVAAVSGVATFGTLTLNLTGTGYTLVASSSGLAGATSATFNVSGGVPSQLAFVQQPSNAVGGAAISPTVTVQVRDVNGNLVPTATNAVTVGIGTNPAGGTLSGTTTVNAVAGVATFANLSIDKSGAGYTLAASAGGLTGATSSTFNVTAGAASQLAITTPPSAAAQSGVAFTQQPVIQVQDALGNAVSQSGVVVTAAIATGGGALGGTTTATTNASGAATFTNLSITGTLGARTLTFTASGLTSATSGAVTLSAGAATQLAITTQPSAAAQSGVAFAQQPVIQLQDASGNAVSQSGVVVTAAIATGGGTLGGTLTATTSAGGAATFTNLAIAGTVGARTLTFTASGLTSATSGTVTLSAGAASQLAITTQPSAAAQSGVAFAPQPVIQIQDAAGNAVSQSGVVVTAAIATGGGTLGGTVTATTSAGGTATFTSLAITGAAGPRTITFTAPSLTSVTSGTVVVGAGAPAQLAITTQPSAAAQSGVAFVQQPVVQLQDASGNAVSQSGVVVTAAIATGGGALGGTLTATTSAGGAATFTNLAIAGAVGARTLTFTASGLTSATSGTVTLSAGAASQLAITTQPSAAAQSGVALAQQPVVQLQDASGNSVSQSGVVVTAAIATGGGTLGGSLTATTSAGGAATFTNLAITGTVGARTLTFTASGLTSVTSGTVTLSAGAATQLAIVTQPSATAASGAAFAQQPVIQLQDAAGNAVSQSGVVVTAAIATGGGTLGGAPTATTGAGGTATFTNLAITGLVGTRTLSFAAAGLTGATSGTINITAGAATQLVFSTEPPASVTSQVGFGAVATAKDGGGNTVTTFTGSVTVAIGTNPAGGTLSGTLAVTASSGVATFAGLSIDNVGNGYTLVATSAGLTSATSTAFNVAAPAGVNAWINPAGGAWSTAANWSKGAVPVATDTVTITQSGTYTVNLDVSATVAKLVAGAPSGTQTLSVATNTLTLGAGNGALATNTILDLSGTGTITGAGTVTDAGTVNWTGGSLGAATAGGGIKVLSGGTLSISPASTVQLQNYTLEVDGTGTWTGTAFINSGSGAILRVGAGAVLNVSGDPTYSNNLGGALSVLDNLGTINRTTSANSFIVNVPVSGTGAWNVQSGSINLQYGGTVSGPVAVTSGATLNLFTGAGALTFDGTSAITGAGSVNFGGGTVTLAGTYNVTGPTLVTAGTANFNTAAGSATNLAVSGGILSGTGVLTVSGPMSVTSGGFGASAGAGGTTRVLSSGTLSLAPTATVNFQGYTLELDGSGTWTGTQTLSTGSGAVLRVANGATLDIQGTPTANNGLGGAFTAINVLGTLTRSTNPGPAVLGVVLNDSGVVSVTAGTLQLGNGGTSTGSFNAAAGDTLEFNGGTHTLGATTRITGAGAVSFTGGSVTTAGGYNVAGTTLVTGGTLTLNGANDTTGTATVASGTLSGTGTLAITSAMNWTGGGLGAASGAGGTARVLPAATLSLAPAATVGLQGYTLELAGTGTWSATQTLQTGSGAVVRVDAGATLAITADPTINTALGGAAPLLDNQGTITRSTSLNPVTIAVPFNQAGTLNIQSGIVNIADGGTMAGPVNESPGTVLLFSNGSVSLANNFRVTGSSALTQLTGGTLGGLTPTDTAFFDNLTLTGGAVSLSGGTIKTPFETIWAGPATVSGGTLFIPGSAGLTMSFTTGSPSLVNATILMASGSGGGWTGTVPLNSGSGAVVRVLAGANMSFSGAGGGFLYNQGGAASLFDNQGTTISAASSGSPGAFTISAPVSNTGSLQVASDTLRLSGGFTSPFPGTLGVVNGATLELAGGGPYTLASPLSLGGNLLLSGAQFVPNGKPVGIAGSFATSGTGSLQLTLATDSMQIGGSAMFSGSASALTAGVLQVGGDFVQNGNGTAFPASGTFRTVLNGAGTQNISFANPTASFFRRLEVSGTTRSVVIQTNVQVTDSMTMFAGGGAATMTGAGTSQRLTVGGLLTLQFSTATPRLTPPVVELSVTPNIAPLAGAFSPDTTVFLGAIASLPVGTGLSYNNVRVNTTGAFAAPSGNVTFNGDLIVSSGTYTTGSGIDSVGGFLRTEGTGALKMVSIVASPTVAVRDSAVFAGGPSTTLTGGVINLYGNFVERGTTGQFAPTGTRVTFQKAAAGVQTIQMADSVNSFFHDLVLNRPSVDTVRLLSNVLVQDSAIVSGSSVLASTTFEALKTPPTGAVRVHSGGVLRPFRAEIGLWGESSADSGTIGSGRISPDTTVFVGTNDTINSVNASIFCGACAWRNVRASGDTLVSLGGFLGLSTVYNGNLLITNGLYMMSALQGTDSVYGFMRTEGSGQLRLASTDGTETLVVRDSAVFSGGSEAGLLGNGGALAVGGGFVQRGGPTSFVGFGSFTTVFDGTGTQTVTFASPGISQSSFANVFVGNASGGASQPTGITLGSNIFLSGNLEDSSTAATDSVLGNGFTVNAGGVSLGSQFVMNNAQLVTNTTNVFFSGLTFRNMATTVTQWTLNVPTGTGITVSGLNFQTPPTTGHYFDALMSAVGGNSMTVTGASPAASAMTGLYTRFNANGPMVVVWNGTQLP